MPEPDEELDANAEFERLLAEGPATPPPARAPKAPPAPLTDADRERLREVERQRTESADMDRRRGLESEMADTSFVGDAVRGLMPTSGGERARERQTERLQSLWDQFTQGDARWGGRNSTAPLVGLDERGAAPLVGFTDSATLGLADEAEGALRAATTDETYEGARDTARQRARRVREQAPQLTEAGQVAGQLPAMLIPGGTSLRGATAIGGGLGAAGAFGASETSVDEDPGQLAWETLIGGLEGAGLGAAGNVGSRALGAAARGPGARAGSELADETLIAAAGPGALQRFELPERAAAAQVLRDTGAIPVAGTSRGTAQSIRAAMERTTDPAQRAILQRVLEPAQAASDQLTEQGLHTMIDPRALLREVGPRAQASGVGFVSRMLENYPAVAQRLANPRSRIVGERAVTRGLPAFLQSTDAQRAESGDGGRSFEAEFLADEPSGGAPSPGSFEAEFLAEPKNTERGAEAAPREPRRMTDEELQALFESLSE